MFQNELSTDETVLDEVPLERLEQEIAGMASRIAAATATWLVWIAAYDRREGWSSWGVKSCAHWLNWQCGMSPRTAREHVWVARRLAEFHELRAVFLAGELSYSKVRAICRVIEPENESELINVARHATASQLDRVAAKMPRPDTGEAQADTSASSQLSFQNNGDGTMTMTLTAPTADVAAIEKAVQVNSSLVIDREHQNPVHQHPEPKTETIKRLGGMNTIRVQTTCAILTGTQSTKRDIDATVLIVADIRAVNGTNLKAESTIENKRVHPEVVRRLCCDSKIQVVLTDADGTERATSSEQRIVPVRLRRLLHRRDHGMCQFPGCESRHRLHAHHITHWANGGPTELSNLISVCGYHHHKLHEGGWNIETTPSGFVFTDPTGHPHRVPTLRLPTRQPLPPTGNGAAAPLAGTGERANINYIADVLISSTAIE